MAPESAWFKSSYSNDTGGSCVEVANLRYHQQVGVRDSKNRIGPAFVVSATAWSSFVGQYNSLDTNWGVARTGT
ncbi:DUF397 domain-containing protein [Streptomyces sp. NPDC053474]|uniref:DUF397 domain-containing protein n=1 Tax=Streptomyces sp. NPDC053474 TaxID=3365704 RepID=UPI0037D10841